MINNNNNAIGVYDSGVGGLTVFKELVNQLPNEKFIYFGDLKNSPYGAKTKEELILIGEKIFDFFKTKNVKAVVMACNTTSALLYDKVKTEYSFKIYPLIQSVAKFIASQNVKRLGVFATAATINSHAYRENILKYNQNMEIFEQACPSWVKIVENKDYSEENIAIIKKDLDEMLKNKPDKIVLGCTHYPFLIDILSEFAPKEIFINPAKNFAQMVKNDMIASNLISTDDKFSECFYVSDKPKQFIESAKMFYNIKETDVLKK